MKNRIVELIQKLRHEKPFEPFRIVTATGDKIVVLDPFNMAVAKSRMICLDPVTERARRIDFSALSDVEVFQRVASE